MDVRAPERVQIDPSSAEWVKYYSDASRRYRRVRRKRRRTPTRQQRNRLVTALMIGSVMLVGAMTSVFYMVLSR
jgi:hypothetical protein